MKVMGPASPATTDRRAVPTVGHTPWNQRVRSLLLGPHGGGTTRRRASDAVRVCIAAVLVVICVPLAQANTSLEIHISDLLSPPPTGIRWLITTIWFVGSIGVTVTLVLIGLLVPRLTAVRQMGVAGLAALLVCLLLDAVLGPAAGRPPVPDLSGFDPRFPILQLAIATAVALAGLPYLSRPLHRIVAAAIGLAGLCAVVGSYGLPLGVVAAVIVGWGTAAACHLAMGAPNGLPSASEVTEAVRDLQIDVRGLASRATTGMGRGVLRRQGSRRPARRVGGLRARRRRRPMAAQGLAILHLQGLGSHALDQPAPTGGARGLPDLSGRPRGDARARVVAAGRCGPAHDAVLVTRLPEGRRLSALPATRSATTTSTNSSEPWSCCAGRGSHTAR